MLTVRELAMFLEASAARVRTEIKRETEHLLEDAAAEAKAMIGHELEEWPDLAERTIAEKQRLGYTGQISETDPLLRTGKLRDSIKAEAAATGAGVEGVVASEDVVALYQEMGTARIPPRPFLAPAMMTAEARSHQAFGELAVELLTPAIR